MSDVAGCRPELFSRYIGHRRKLAPENELFEAGNLERETLARGVADSAVQAMLDQYMEPSALSSFECVACRAPLPTARLLDIHVSELHDSYWAAQAANHLPVYMCLVEGCSQKFCTNEERRQHLIGHHKFAPTYKFDRIHLRRRRRKGVKHPSQCDQVGAVDKMNLDTSLTKLSLEVPDQISFGRRRLGKGLVHRAQE